MGAYLLEDEQGKTPQHSTLAHEMPFFALMSLAARDEAMEKTFAEIMLASALYANYFIKPRQELCAPFFFPFDLLLHDRVQKDDIFLGVDSSGKRLSAKYMRGFLSGWVGSQSVEAQFLAMQLGDEQLEQAAEEMLRWQFGHNPFGVNLMAGLGETWKQDIMSTHLGFIPGMMSNVHFPDKINPELPLYRHYGQNEIYSQTQAPFQAALSLQNARRRIRGTIAGAENTLLKVNQVEYKTDGQGSFEVLVGDPGKYKIEVDGMLFASGFAARGLNYLGTLNTSSPVLLQKAVIDLEQGMLEIQVTNAAKQKLPLSIGFHGVGMETPPMRTWTLTPGLNRIRLKIKINAPPESAGGIFAYAKNNRRNFVYALFDW